MWQPAADRSARPPPLICDRCFRTELSAVMSAPAMRRRRVVSFFSSRLMPGAGAASSADAPPDSSKSKRSRASVDSATAQRPAPCQLAAGRRQRVPSGDRFERRRHSGGLRRDDQPADDPVAQRARRAVGHRGRGLAGGDHTETIGGGEVGIRGQGADHERRRFNRRQAGAHDRVEVAAEWGHGAWSVRRCATSNPASISSARTIAEWSHA